jgi:hypothetical protein
MGIVSGVLLCALAAQEVAAACRGARRGYEVIQNLHAANSNTPLNLVPMLGERMLALVEGAEVHAHAGTHACMHAGRQAER